MLYTLHCPGFTACRCVHCHTRYESECRVVFITHHTESIRQHATYDEDKIQITTLQMFAPNSSYATYL